MKSTFVKYIFLTASIISLISSCSVFGGKQNDTVDQVLQQGQIDPNLVPKAVSYVPVFPFLKVSKIL